MIIKNHAGGSCIIMKSDYESKHTDSARRKTDSAGSSRSGSSKVTREQASRPVRSSSQRKKKRRGSGAVIGIALFLIVAALIILGVVWFVILKPGLSQQGSDTAAPVSSPVSEEAVSPTPEPTPESTPEPTPEPELAYSSVSRVIGSGDYITDGVVDGITFRNPSVASLSDGRSLSITDGEVVVLGTGGQQEGTIPCDGTPGGLVLLGNGRAAVISWVENQQKLQILREDLSSVEETIALPSSAVCFADGNSRYLYFYSTGSDLYGVEENNSEPVPILNWTAVNVSGSRVSNITVGDNNTFYCLSNTWQDDSFSYSSSLITVSGTPKDPSVQKKELVLLSVNPVEDLQDAIVSFNKSQDTTAIILKTFDPAEDDVETVRALLQLAGNSKDNACPDILDLTGMPYETLAAAGMLEDLYPLLDADGELSRTSFVPQALSAMEVNGKLYGTSSGFTLGTVVGPARLLGNMKSWTIRDFNNITSTMGEGTYAFGAVDTQSNVLYDLLGIHLHRFVNWENMTCSFDNADFTSVLEFIRKLPADYLDTVDAEQIQKNIQLFLRTTLYAAEDLQAAGSNYASPVYVGLPVIEGGGNVLNLQKGFAITASCADKEAAWQFIRSSLTAEAQAKSWVFPSNADAFDAYIASAGESAALLRELLSNSSGNSADPAIHKLVLDNISGFLKGAESSATAASKVQSAVSEYLSSLK